MYWLTLECGSTDQREDDSHKAQWLYNSDIVHGSGGIEDGGIEEGTECSISRLRPRRAKRWH